MMRRRSWRLVFTGIVLVALALTFYFMMPGSTDPAALMKLVDSISGAALGLSIVFILIGLIGRKA